MKTERFEMRFEPKDKRRAERAAEKRGASLADFVRVAVAEKADAVLGVIGNSK